MGEAMVQTTQQGQSAGQAYCPHCFLVVAEHADGPWPPQPTRCPHCRLMIGAERGRSSPEANPGARGTAAGVFAQQARQADGDEEDFATADEVRWAIRSVAERIGLRPERLLMVDYQQHAAGDDTLPELSEVFAAFGSWKRARREAATG